MGKHFKKNIFLIYIGMLHHEASYFSGVIVALFLPAVLTMCSNALMNIYELSRHLGIHLEQPFL